MNFDSTVLYKQGFIYSRAHYIYNYIEVFKRVMIKRSVKRAISPMDLKSKEIPYAVLLTRDDDALADWMMLYFSMMFHYFFLVKVLHPF